MEYIYVLMDDGDEWEDLTIYVTREEAIEVSIRNPTSRVEIFAKKISSDGQKGPYRPTYNFYQNGILVDTSMK